MKYVVTGYDLDGNRVTEMIDVTPVTRMQRMRTVIAAYLPQNWGYHLGLTKFRTIKSINVKP